MIWLSRKDEFKRIILTLNSRHLEFIGAFEFLVREKKIVKLHDAEVPKFYLFLSTEARDYESTVPVSRKKYDQAMLEKYYGLCGVIRNIKHEEFILVTENTNPDTAIRQVVRKSWEKMLFIMIIFGFCLGTLLIFIYPLLHLSWN